MSKKYRRELERYAEQIGLEPVDHGNDQRHAWVRFKNEQGMVLRKTMSQGAGGNVQRRDLLNAKGELKRFARGQTHGLIIERSEA